MWARVVTPSIQVKTNNYIRSLDSFFTRNGSSILGYFPSILSNILPILSPVDASSCDNCLRLDFTTIIIGFYDLYKNIRLLKATAASLCGPLFEWIEAWEMISRIQYLGTMLFLQNFERALKWLLMVIHVSRPTLSPVKKPLMDLFMEVLELAALIWSLFVKTGELHFSTVWTTIQPSCTMVLEMVLVLLSPFELV